MEEHHTQTHHSHKGMSYGRFIWMIVLSFIAMYGLMYAMVDRMENVIPNVNQLYMAGLMTAAMVVIEMALMGRMYRSKRTNAVIVIIGMIALAGFFIGIRQQTCVADRQFLKSMIPHHAAAVLMVKQADLTDPEIRQLAEDIIEAQEKEIAFMKAKLEAMDK
jgi:uncharacterized protein (DUF305 family)